MTKKEAARRHWRATITLTLALLAVWAVVGLGCGILLADVLNGFKLAGYPLGFWFAQQGSILTFVVLILIYVVGMTAIDRAYRRRITTPQA